MKRTFASIGLCAALGCAVLGYAQPPAEQPIGERVAALEREVARLGTRTDLREAASSPAAATQLSARIDEIERAVTRLTADLQRIERQADSALREATAAQRTAQDAQRLARDATMNRR
jgi:hypothetical protein